MNRASTIRPSVRLAVVAALLAAALLSGCGGGGKKTPTTTPSTLPGAGTGFTGTTSAPGTFAVQIVTSGSTWKFQPPSVTVAAGTAVTWTNDTDVSHNVIFSDASVKSSDLFAKGESFKTTLDKPGTFAYICGIHPDMKGSITVQ
jgi:plastocyanin